MHLAENIHDYYMAHLGDLTEEKQFHLCSRLAIWSKDEQALAWLQDYKKPYVPDPCTKALLQAILQKLVDNPPEMPANAAALRTAYFEQYSWVRGLELALFRVRHWLEVYDVDARPALFEIVSRRQLLAYKEELLQDEEAMRMLSTYAINYIYLLERVILEHTDNEAIDTAQLLAIGDGYRTDDILHLQLLVYYYTHCIIGESNFYARDIPPLLLPVYLGMLQRLDAVIDEHFESLSLDTKLEFLVCARLCGYEAEVESDIISECSQSVSFEGTFLVDTHNAFAGRDSKKTFSASEHRNVLFVMASTPQSI
jgi:hypothetical protein